MGSRKRVNRHMATILTIGLGANLLAGQYVVTYMGGEFAIVGPSGVEWTVPYTGQQPGGWGGSEVAGEEPPPGMEQIGTEIGSVTGRYEISVTLTWVPDAGESPPPGLLIKKYSKARWEGQSGSAANGLGDQEQVDPDGMHGESVGTHWEYIQNPGTTIPYTITPSVTGASSEPGEVFPFASVLVEFTPYNVTIDLGNTIPSPDNKIAGRILVGKPLTGILDISEAPIQIDDQTWTITDDAGLFRDYIPTQSAGIYTPYVNPTMGTAVVAYFRKEGQPTVTCVATSPQLTSPMTVTVRVQVEEPDVNMNMLEAIGAFAIYDELLPDGTTVKRFRLTGVPVPGGLGLTGIALSTWVTTPQEYVDAYTSGHGAFGWANILHKRDRWIDTQGVPLYFSPPRPPGVYELDNNYPYPIRIIGPPVHWMTADLQRRGQVFPFTDRPGFDIKNSPDVYQLIYDTDFRTYLMYRAPGECKHVPLWRWDWLAAGTATQAPFATWSGQDDGSTLGPRQDSPEHPVWTGFIPPPP